MRQPTQPRRDSEGVPAHGWAVSTVPSTRASVRSLVRKSRDETNSRWSRARVPPAWRYGAGTSGVHESAGRPTVSEKWKTAWTNFGSGRKTGLSKGKHGASCQVFRPRSWSNGDRVAEGSRSREERRVRRCAGDLNRSTNRLRRKFDPLDKWIETRPQVESVMDDARKINQVMVRGK